MTRPRVALVLWLALGLGVVAAPLAARGQDVEDVDAALAALLAGDDLTGRVPDAVALMAAGRVDSRVAPGDLDRLATVAQAGGAVPALTRSLARLVAEGEGGEGDAELTRRGLAWLGRLTPAALDAAVVDLGGESVWIEHLLDLADGSDDALACASLELVARDGPPEVLQEYLARVSAAGGVARARDLRLVQALALTRRPLEVYQALVRLELAPELYEPVGDSLSALVARDAATTECALDHASQGIWGWGSVVLRTLGSIPTESHARARPFVLHALENGAGYHLAAAVISGTKLRLPELAPMLPDLAASGDLLEVRVAAIRAIPILRARDPGTIDALIALLEDRAVAKEAHRALLRQSGLRLPLRAEAWRAWRTKQQAEEAAAEAPPVGPPLAAPPATIVAPDEGRRLSWWPLVALVAGAAGAAGAARAFASTPATTPATTPPAEPTVRPSRTNTTRLERLGSDLDERPSASDEESVAASGAVVHSLREALRPVVAEGAPATVTPALLDAMRELVRLGRGAGDPMDTAAFDQLQVAVAQVEGTLPGGGGNLGEVSRECCFVLLQIAFLRRTERAVAPDLTARLVELLAELDRRLPASLVVSAQPTLDVAAAFPELTSAPGAAAPPAVERTLDATTAFAEPPPLDAPTLDIAAAFGDAVVPDARSVDPGTVDVAVVFPEPRAD